MNSRPMILRFASGSVTPASFPRKRARASTVTSGRWKLRPKTSSTCSRSRARSRPLSTKMHRSRSPIARWTSSAATAESTPPESAQMAWPALHLGPDLLHGHLGVRPHRPEPEQPHTPYAKFRSTSAPRGVCTTSGWNCTAKNRRRGSSTAAKGHDGVEATGSNPGGRASTRSPWLIHTSSSRREPLEERGRLLHVDRRGPVLTVGRSRHPAAQLVRQELQPVADPEHRYAQLVDGAVGARAPLGEHAGWAAGEHDAAGARRRGSARRWRCRAGSRSRRPARAAGAR